MTEEKDIEKLKKVYNELKKKYSMPEFSEMNNNFGIEELSEDSDTEYFLRRLRLCIVERIVGLLRVLESIMNPSNSPIFIHVIAKNLDNNSKSVIEELYKEGCGIEIRSITESLLEYSEKSEAELIKEIISKWTVMKPKINRLNNFILDAWKKDSLGSDKSYMG